MDTMHRFSHHIHMNKRKNQSKCDESPSRLNLVPGERNAFDHIQGNLQEHAGLCSLSIGAHQ